MEGCTQTVSAPVIHTFSYRHTCIPMLSYTGTLYRMRMTVQEMDSSRNRADENIAQNSAPAKTYVYREPYTYTPPPSYIILVLTGMEQQRSPLRRRKPFTRRPHTRHTRTPMTTTNTDRTTLNDVTSWKYPTENEDCKDRHKTCKIRYI